MTRRVAAGLPARVFHAAAEGVDKRGIPCRRILPSLFQVRMIEITPLRRVEALRVGATRFLSFQIGNPGPAAATEATAVWVNPNIVESGVPVRVALSAGEAAAVEADVDRPAGALRDTEAAASVAASRVTPPASENGIAVRPAIR
jgi:hypothetical protein